MKLVHFLLQEQFHFGMLTDANEYIDLDTACRDYFGVNPVKGADPSRFRDMRAFFAGGPDSVEVTRKIVEYIERRRKMGWTPRAATGARFLFKPEEGVRLLAPVVPGVKIYCLASNSKSHLAEQGKPAPPRPFLFTRFANSLVGPGEPLVLHSVGQHADLEVELALVIGKRGKHIPAAQAYEHVAGYTIALDMAYRDLQYPEAGTVDWVMGKGFDGSLAVGPWIVPKEEVGHPYPLRMRLKIGNDTWQSGDSSDYLFQIPQVIEHLSRGITLEAGDLISLGSLGGAPGFAFGSPGRKLAAGMAVEAEIERIGRLMVPVRPEAPPTPAPAPPA
ncbi:MAG: fumarylacetoacetate hydrolase family protein [Thermoplasmata archaeon]|nr:fumarylacetoacetate hydrolase family protein [Thermoplasmata archaeon]MCI4338393.1 fumarylacetoacetate hydrolase family protein [Thermoplasmata archaeon]MCI4341171.1 fumarylacetoacetate hydrolase family protein [Thermoplasmata archaeon]